MYTVGVLLSCIVIISVEYFHLIILTLLVFNIYFKADKMNQNWINIFYLVTFLKKTLLSQIKSLFSFLHSIAKQFKILK